jgi:hypothetical protein
MVWLGGTGLLTVKKKVKPVSRGKREKTVATKRRELQNRQPINTRAVSNRANKTSYRSSWLSAATSGVVSCAGVVLRDCAGAGVVFRDCAGDVRWLVGGDAVGDGPSRSKGLQSDAEAQHQQPQEQTGRDWPART